MPHRMMPPVAVLLLLLACSHTEPFPTGADMPGGPFDGNQPTRLTFSGFDDFDPTTSTDGFVSYQFRRGTTDRDICAGVLPDRGGQRVAEVCAWETNDASRSDRFAAAVLLPGERMAWTRHQGGLGNQAPSEGGLYLGPTDQPRTAARVLALLERPAGASARWDLLIDPRQTGPDEITALAAQWIIGPTIKFGPPDTVLVGVEIARINLATQPASISVVAPATGAVAWAWDPAQDAYYILRPTYAPPTEDSVYKPVADTIFRVTAAATTPVYGRPTMTGQVAGRLDGFAARGGRLFVARRWFEYPEPPSPRVLQTASRLVEIVDDVEQVPLGSRLGPGGDRWGRLALTGDGSGLIAESVLGGQHDLYRFGVGP